MSALAPTAEGLESRKEAPLPRSTANASRQQNGTVRFSNGETVEVGSGNDSSDGEDEDEGKEGSSPLEHSRGHREPVLCPAQAAARAAAARAAAATAAAATAAGAAAEAAVAAATKAQSAYKDARAARDAQWCEDPTCMRAFLGCSEGAGGRHPPAWAVEVRTPGFRFPKKAPRLADGQKRVTCTGVSHMPHQPHIDAALGAVRQASKLGARAVVLYVPYGPDFQQVRALVAGELGSAEDEQMARECEKCAVQVIHWPGGRGALPDQTAAACSAAAPREARNTTGDEACLAQLYATLNYGDLVAKLAARHVECIRERLRKAREEEAGARSEARGHAGAAHEVLTEKTFTNAIVREYHQNAARGLMRNANGLEAAVQDAERVAEEECGVPRGRTASLSKAHAQVLEGAGVGHICRVAGPSEGGGFIQAVRLAMTVRGAAPRPAEGLRAAIAAAIRREGGSRVSQEEIDDVVAMAVAHGETVASTPIGRALAKGEPITATVVAAHVAHPDTTLGTALHARIAGGVAAGEGAVGVSVVIWPAAGDGRARSHIAADDAKAAAAVAAGGAAAPIVLVPARAGPSPLAWSIMETVAVPTRESTAVVAARAGTVAVLRTASGAEVPAVMVDNRENGRVLALRASDTAAVPARSVPEAPFVLAAEEVAMIIEQSRRTEGPSGRPNRRPRGRRAQHST